MVKINLKLISKKFEEIRHMLLKKVDKNDLYNNHLKNRVRNLIENRYEKKGIPTSASSIRRFPEHKEITSLIHIALHESYNELEFQGNMKKAIYNGSCILIYPSISNTKISIEVAYKWGSLMRGDFDYGKGLFVTGIHYQLDPGNPKHRKMNAFLNYLLWGKPTPGFKYDRSVDIEPRKLFDDFTHYELYVGKNSIMAGVRAYFKKVFSKITDTRTGEPIVDSLLKSIKKVVDIWSD